MQLSKREGRNAIILTLVSNPIIWISDPKFWILQVRQSLLSTKKQLWSVIPFSTPLTSFVDLIKVYQYRQGDITEERGTLPHRPGRGEIWTVQTDGDRLSSVLFRPRQSWSR